MNKRIRALLHLIILCLGVILPSVAPLTQVQAAEFGDVIYEKSTAEGGARYFDATKHYLWPVPNPERQKNPLLGQNPGWEK